MVGIPSNKRHGESGSRLHHIWCDMRKRCSNPNEKWFHRYGGRGIKICAEWSDFINFRQWALESGYSDSLTIDRIDSNGDYEPSNCRWATQKEQTRNQSANKIIAYRGDRKCLAEWIEELGLNGELIRSRIKRGWPAQEAFTVPAIPKQKNSKGQFYGRESHLV